MEIERRRDIYIYIYLYTYVYVRMYARERESERDGGDLRHREMEEGIGREGCDYNISPRYCYRSRRSEGICYVHCFSFAPSSKRRSRGPGVPFTVLKGIRAHHLYLFSTLSFFPISRPLFLLPFPFLDVLFLPPPGISFSPTFAGLFYMTISTPKKRLTLHSKRGRGKAIGRTKREAYVSNK